MVARMTPSQNPIAKNGLRGTNQSGMRAHNERLVLAILRRYGALPKAEIARMTGLSAQTVSVIVRALELDGFLTKGDPVKGKVGQPSVPIELAGNGAYFYGLKIGRRNAELVLTDFLGNIIARDNLFYNYPNYAEIRRYVLTTIEALASSIPEQNRDRIAGLGVALPYYLWDWAHALDVPQDKMLEWKTVNIEDDLSDALGLPVFSLNDASAACSAQLIFDKDAPSNFIYFHLGFFIGGGIVIDNKIFTGINGNAAALGSLPVLNAHGEACQLIDIASVGELERELSKALGKSVSLWQNPNDWDIDSTIVNDWITRSASAIAQAIPAVISVIDINHIYIDGWVTPEIKTALINGVRAHLQRQNFAGLSLPTVASGSLGSEAKTLGAASLPLSQKYLIDTKALMNS